MDVFGRIMEGLDAQDAEPQTVMIDATYLKAHRTASIRSSCRRWSFGGRHLRLVMSRGDTPNAPLK